MKSALPPGMLDAMRLTHAGRLTEAAAALQQMLRGQVAPGSVYSRTRRGYSTIDEMDEKAATEIRRQPGAASMSGVHRPPFGIVAETMHPTMPDGLRGFFDQVGRGGLQMPAGTATGDRAGDGSLPPGT